jgi:glutathione S-transferase
MQLYVTLTSPYARLARIVVVEKGLQDRVEIVPAKTRTPDSPYYRINPSGRVPFLVAAGGLAMEDSRIICAYLDGLDGAPSLHPATDQDWSHRRLEASARSMLDGIAVWAREVRRPETERSPATRAHETARIKRMADLFESTVDHPVLRSGPNMAQLVLAVALETAHARTFGDLTEGRPRLAQWLAPIAQRPAMLATAPPKRS